MAYKESLLLNHLARLKSAYESAILAKDGNSGNAIRSGKIIEELHEYVKEELINNRVPADLIFPPLGKSSPEKAIQGYFKSKDQDVLVESRRGTPAISINIRSQLSSIQKNYDTLFERLTAESVNIHEKYPYLPCGYLYLLPVFGYDSQAMKQNKVERNEKFNWEKYLVTFNLLANRNGPEDKAYKYEKICLLAVDFSTKTPTILKTTQDFLSRNLISEDFAAGFDYSTLTPVNFISNLIKIYSEWVIPDYILDAEGVEK